MIVVVDGNEGTGKSTLVRALQKLHLDARDGGAPSHIADHPDAPYVDGEVYVILDLPVRTCRRRLKKAGRDLQNPRHTKEGLTRYAQRFLEIAPELPHCAIVSAKGKPATVLERTLTALARLGVTAPQER